MPMTFSCMTTRQTERDPPCGALHLRRLSQSHQFLSRVVEGCLRARIDQPNKATRKISRPALGHRQAISWPRAEVTIPPLIPSLGGCTLTLLVSPTRRGAFAPASCFSQIFQINQQFPYPF